jgi:hypothetical protein
MSNYMHTYRHFIFYTKSTVQSSIVDQQCVIPVFKYIINKIKYWAHISFIYNNNNNNNNNSSEHLNF